MRPYILLLLILVLTVQLGAKEKKGKLNQANIAIDYLNGSFDVYNKLQQQIP